MVFFRQKIDIPLVTLDTLLWDERVDFLKTAGVFKCPLADWVQVGSHKLPRPARFEHFLNIWKLFPQVALCGWMSP